MYITIDNERKKVEHMTDLKNSIPQTPIKKHPRSHINYSNSNTPNPKKAKIKVYIPIKISPNPYTRFIAASQTQISYRENKYKEELKLNLDGKVCYYRKVYQKIKDIILKQYHNQQNFIIFGCPGIGKTVLAKYLKKIITDNGNCILIYKYLQGKETKEIIYGKPANSIIQKPCIVISDGVIIEDNEYLNASSIILIANFFDDKHASFHNKRAAATIYIPRFSLEEIESFLDVMNYDANEKKNYRNNFKYYHGVIKNYKMNEENIIKIVEKKGIKMLDEIIGSLNISPFSKGDFDKLVIYDDSNKDVTVSNGLIFISDEIKKVVEEKLAKSKDKDYYKNCIEQLYQATSGRMIGNTYEEVVLYLLKKTKLMETLTNRILKASQDVYNSYKEKLKSVGIVDIQNDEHFNKIINDYQNFCSNDRLVMLDLSYNQCFPDIDFLIGPFAFQITVNSSHETAPEILIILQKMYKLVNGFYLFYISPQNEVKPKCKMNRTIDKYPLAFQKLIPEGFDEKQKDSIFFKHKNNVHTILITFEELMYYADTL